MNVNLFLKKHEGPFFANVAFCSRVTRHWGPANRLCPQEPFGCWSRIQALYCRSSVLWLLPPLRTATDRWKRGTLSRSKRGDGFWSWTLMLFTSRSLWLVGLTTDLGCYDCYHTWLFNATIWLVVFYLCYDLIGCFLSEGPSLLRLGYLFLSSNQSI